MCGTLPVDLDPPQDDMDLTQHGAHTSSEQTISLLPHTFQLVISNTWLTAGSDLQFNPTLAGDQTTYPVPLHSSAKAPGAPAGSPPFAPAFAAASASGRPVAAADSSGPLAGRAVAGSSSSAAAVSSASGTNAAWRQPRQGVAYA